jgi:hypothetical protein
MKKMLTAMVACLAVIGFSAAPASAAQTATSVTFDNLEPFPTSTLWSGDIFSARKSCKNNRRVYIYRTRNGPDQLRGSTLSYKGSSQPGYYWVYSESGHPPAGYYYAKVRATQYCKGARSNLIGFA